MHTLTIPSQNSENGNKNKFLVSNVNILRFRECMATETVWHSLPESEIVIIHLYLSTLHLRTSGKTYVYYRDRNCFVVHSAMFCFFTENR